MTGSGAGTLSGNVINWSASGLVGAGRRELPVHVHQQQGDAGADGQVVVNYTGTVCGIPVSGTETVKK